ncbi:MAG: STAS domain-containing protein [Holophagales bacterium]|jgi:anti-sigma B factor antagonist|nr:STAS domain-containing protein [Holophagales bacterium]
MTDLSIQVRKLDGASVIEPAGFINAHTVRHFESALEAIIQEGCYNILLQCSDLAYISSAGLGAIMGQIEVVRENGGDIMLSNLQENVFAIFDTLGFTQLYKVFKSEQEAIRALKNADGPS